MLESKPIKLDIAKRDLIEGFIKGLEVIQAFNRDTQHMTASELAERTGLSRSAARRYLLTLAHLGMVASDGRKFWLTPTVLNLGQSYLDSARLPRAITPFLQQLTQQLQESTNFAILDGKEVVYVSRVNNPRTLATGFAPGTRLPAYTSTAGRVLLAMLPDEELTAYLEEIELVPYTHATVTEKAKLYEELQLVRKQGWSVTENQYEVGLRGISVPVKSRSGAVLGAISVSMNAAGSTLAAATSKCLPALQATANTLLMWI